MYKIAVVGKSGMVKIICEHRWVRISYGYDKEYFICKDCGKKQW